MNLAVPPLDLVIRADASRGIGAGHVMRCGALAEEWLRLGVGSVTLAGVVDIPFVHGRLNALGLAISPDRDMRLAHVVVVDTYDREERAQLGASGIGLLRFLVDDLGEVVPPGYQVVWNPNPYSSADLYDHFGGALITGRDAVPIRAGLPAWMPMVPGRTGVMLGAGSVSDTVRRAFRLLAQDTSLGSFCGPGEWLPPAWEQLDTHDPWWQLARCERLITSCGASMWEAAAIGIPLVLVQTADNQRLAAEWGGRAGVPAIVAEQTQSAEALAAALREALPNSRPLPHLASGCGQVVARLLELAGQARGTGAFTQASRGRRGDAGQDR